MSTHDRNLVLLILMSMTLISLNFFAVITGAADGFYDQLTDLLMPVFMR
jgi:hypothetical protein